MKFGIATLVLVSSSVSSLSQASQQATQQDLESLARNLYHEERSSKATDSQIAQVAFVVLNRVRSSNYPDSIKEVIYQRKQFSWTHDKHTDSMNDYYAQRRAYQIASRVLEGSEPNLIGNATHYLNKDASNATWYRYMKFRGKYYKHWFYKEER